MFAIIASVLIFTSCSKKKTESTQSVDTTFIEAQMDVDTTASVSIPVDSSAINPNNRGIGTVKNE